MSKVPIPQRMKHLPVDRRGLPTPWIVYVDQEGRPHFTINDVKKTERVRAEDLCGICGTKLHRGRWFVGGPMSAFHEHGAYFDPPMHHECMTYAMKICPYLALPNYSDTKRIDDKTLKPDEPITMFVDNTMIPERPILFVAVMTIGHRFSRNGHYLPNKPYRRIEFWQHGSQLDPFIGEAMCVELLERPLPPLRSPRVILR